MSFLSLVFGLLFLCGVHLRFSLVLGLTVLAERFHVECLSSGA